MMGLCQVVFLISTMPRFPMTTCPTGSYLKSDTCIWQSQLKFVVPISKSLILCLKLPAIVFVKE